MFGRGWEPGLATIVAMKEVWTGSHEASAVGGGAKLKTYEFVADVQPAGKGELFRTVMHEPFDERHWIRPIVGDTVAVQCDPGRRKAKFDTSGATAARKSQKEDDKRKRTAQAAQFDAVLNAAPGTPAPVAEGGREPATVAETRRILADIKKQAAEASDDPSAEGGVSNAKADGPESTAH